MTLLIFETPERVFATTAWTAQSTASFGVSITFLREQGMEGAHQRVFFAMTMTEFLARAVNGVIDMRGATP